MSTGQNVPRASLSGALFRCLAAILPLFVATSVLPLRATADACQSEVFDSAGSVDFVIDGDTVVLDDGRHIRFIVINSPEISHSNEPSQPLAKAAKAYLETLVLKKHVDLLFDAERRDKYGRSLAHVYRVGGTNVTAELLGEGLGALLVIPPNVALLTCYAEAESRARSQRRGIWDLPSYQFQIASKVAKKYNQYVFLNGVVNNVSRTQRAYYVELNGGVSLKISVADSAYFDWNWLRGLEGKVVNARGWMHAGRRSANIRLRHPQMLEVLP